MNPEEVETLLNGLQGVKAPDVEARLAEIARTRRRRPAFGQLAAIAASLLILGTVFVLILAPQESRTPAGAQDSELDRKIADLVSKLGLDDLAAREAAAKDLIKLGPDALAALRQRRGAVTDPEIAARLDGIIDEITRPRFRLEKEIDWKGYVPVFGDAWSPDGSRLFLGNKLFDTRDWTSTSPFKIVGASAFSPDGKTLAMTTHTGLAFYETDDFKQISRFDAKPFMGPVRFLDANRVVFVAEYRWKGRDGGGGTHEGPGSAISIAVRKDGVWGVERDIRGGTNMYEVTPDGKYIIAGGQTYSTETGERVEGFGRVAVMSPDRKQMVGASFAGPPGPGTLKLWAYGSKTGTPIVSLDVPEGSENRIAFTPDSKTIFVAGDDRKLRAFRCSDGAEIATIALYGTPTILRCSPRGDVIVVGSVDPAAGRWVDSTPRKVQVFRLGAK